MDKKKLALYGCWYASQGAAFTLLGKIGLFRLTDAGFSPWEVAMFAAFVGWSWALKFLWGAAIDRIGHKPVWAFGGALGVVVGLCVLSGYSSPDPSQLLWVGSWLSLSIAIQDVAIDGLAADWFASRREQGTSQGVAWAARALGAVFGGGVMLRYQDLLQWRGQCLAVAGFVLVFGLVLPRILLERGSGAGHTSAPQKEVEKTRRADHLLLVLGFVTAAAYMTAAAFTYPVAKAVYNVIGWRNQEELALLETLGPLSGLLGSVFAIYAVAKLSRARGLFLANLLLVVVFGSIGVVGLAGWEGEKSLLFGLFLATDFVATVYRVALFAIFVEIARQYRSRAAIFALIMAGTNLAGMWGKMAAPGIVQAAGLAGTFVAGAMCQLLVVIPALFAARRMERRDRKS